MCMYERLCLIVYLLNKKDIWDQYIYQSIELSVRVYDSHLAFLLFMFCDLCLNYSFIFMDTWSGCEMSGSIPRWIFVLK